LCGIPKIYLNAIASPKLGLKPEPENIFLHGLQGSGKTYQACGCVKHWLPKLERPNATYEEDRMLSRFKTVPEILMEIRGTFNNQNQSSQSETDIVHKYLRPKLLIMDDFAAEKVTDWSLSALYVILSGRINSGKATVVTSNMTISEIEKFDPRIASRFAGFKIVKVTGKDRRQTMAARVEI